MGWQELLRHVAGVFGLSENQPFSYYKDVLLGVICAIAVTVATVLALERELGWKLFGAVGVAVLCVVLAKSKRGVMAGALFVLAIRFAFAFLISARPTALGGAVACGVAGFALLRIRITRPI